MKRGGCRMAAKKDKREGNDLTMLKQKILVKEGSDFLGYDSPFVQNSSSSNIQQ